MKRKIAILSLILFIGTTPLQNGHVTIYMIGDSTMADKPTDDNPERGWGQMFPLFFDTSVTIENHARNGRSTKSFLAESLWQPILEKLQPGDYVFIQFGHNDEKKEKVGRYTPPEEYRTNLIRFVTDTREKRGEPILCTPIVRRRFDSTGTFYDEHGIYPDVVRDVAAELNVPLIDMHRMSLKLVTDLGVEESKKIFLWVEPGKYKSLPDGKVDNTHFSEEGATKMAALAAQGLKNLNIGLSAHLKN